MTTQTQHEHECVSQHCIVCCPRSQGFNEGYESARQIYGTERRMRLLDPPPFALAGVTMLVLLVCVLTLAHRIEKLEKLSNVVN